MNELVSIIIPVYNVKEYLQECVFSVIGQTYSTLEIILVDDGSTDISGQLCDKLKSQDSRISVIHKTNGGLSSARNAGLDVCKGDYIYFLDSDDFLERTVIERYLNIIHSTNADVCRGSFFLFCGNLQHNNVCCKDATVETFSTVEALKLMFMDEKLYHAATCGLFRKALFDSVRFPVGFLYEDFATTYHLIAQCKIIAFTDDKAYFYRTRHDSIMNATVSKADMVLLDIAENVTRDIVSLFPEVEKEANRKIIVSYLKFYSRILYSGFHSFDKEQLRIQKKVLELGKPFINSGLASWNDLIKITAYKLGKLPFYLVYRVSDGINRRKQIHILHSNSDYKTTLNKNPAKQ